MKNYIFLYVCLILSNNIYCCSKGDLAPKYVLTPKNVVEELFKIYADAAQENYIGEEISQLEHGLQAAHQALQSAEQAKYSGIIAPHSVSNDTGIDEESVIAALFHDIGHRIVVEDTEQMDGLGVKSHDKLGAAFLAARGFSHKVISLIGGHVDAKRYMVFKDNAYYQTLSEASKNTLAYQNGPMKEEEANEFEKNEYFKQILLLRTFDNQAKIPGAQTPPLEFYRGMILRHLEKNISK